MDDVERVLEFALRDIVANLDSDSDNDNTDLNLPPPFNYASFKFSVLLMESRSMGGLTTNI